MADKYGSDKGKFQLAYDYFWNLLIPKSGRSEYPEGELLRWVSRYYYRYNNDGDSYEDCQEHMGFPDICKLKGIDSKVLNKIDLYLCREEYDTAADETLKYIMLKRSSEDKIWNPKTNRLVSISNPVGQNALKLLDCKLTYTNIL